MGLVPTKFQDWIRRQVLSTTRPEGRCVRITVRHLSAGKNTMGDVDSIAIPDGSDCTDEFMADVGFKLWESAQNDANGLGRGRQNYAFIAFYEEEPQKQGSRYSARFDCENVDEEDGSQDPTQSEGPNKAGITSQLMRHTEAAVRLATYGASQTINAQQRQIDSLFQTVEKMSRTHLELITAREDLMDRKAQRDLETARESAKTALQYEAIDALKPFLPIVAAKLSGNKLLGVGKGPDALKAFVSSIKADQLEKLSQHLTAEQQMLVGAMLQEVQAEEEKKATLEAANGANGGTH